MATKHGIVTMSTSVSDVDAQNNAAFVFVVVMTVVSASFVLFANIDKIISGKESALNERLDVLEVELDQIKDTLFSVNEDEDEDEDNDEGNDEDADEDNDEDNDEGNDEGNDEDADADDEADARGACIPVSPISDLEAETEVSEINVLKGSIGAQVAHIQSTLESHAKDIRSLVWQLKDFDIDPNHYQAWTGDAEGDTWSLNIKMVRNKLSSYHDNSIWSSWDGTNDGSIMSRDSNIGATDFNASWNVKSGEITKSYCTNNWKSVTDITVTLRHDGAMSVEQCAAILANEHKQKKIVWKRILLKLNT